MRKWVEWGMGGTYVRRNEEQSKTKSKRSEKPTCDLAISVPPEIYFQIRLRRCIGSTFSSDSKNSQEKWQCSL